ncbi:MAG: hypothetical protein Kow0029_02890 [Candidatus Rifleibacteriota bacterium]
MKRAGLLVLTVLFLLFACIVQAKDSGVRFSDLSGEVLVRPDEDRLAWELADLDMILYVMDHIKTGRDASAILSLADMTTFVMKPESEIILNTESEKENKIELLAGKVWVNVKKMVKDGSMSVKMSQAVAGIKGTNITCSSNEDGSENRVKVLRGEARVMILETREEIPVGQGEELVIKKGGKSEKQEIDIEEEQKNWEEITSRLGETIQMNEIPETIRKINESEALEIAQLNEDFKRFLSQQSVSFEDISELKKSADRFIGMVLEDNLILNSMRSKVNNALTTPGISESNRAILAGYLKQIADSSNAIKGYQVEAEKILKYEFSESCEPNEDVSQELEILSNEYNSVASDFDSVKPELEKIIATVLEVQNSFSNAQSGMSQDYYTELMESLKDNVSDLEGYLSKLNDLKEKLAGMLDGLRTLMDKNPQDQNIQIMQRKITVLQNEIQSILNQISSIESSSINLERDYAVTEVEPGAITKLQDLDDAISDQIVILQNEISAYNSISQSETDVAERRLQSSLKIMDSYARVRRNYLSAQRLYESTMREIAGSKIITSEQQEIIDTWQRISNTFQQLGIVAEELQSNIESLESQLRQWLK